MNTKAKGYIYGAVAAATYGMNPLFALPLYENGMNTNSVLFFRYLFAIPILAIMIKSRGRDFAVHKADLFPLAVMGLLVAVSSLALFLSYNYMDAGVASTILFVYPIMVAVIMAFVFKEKISWFTIICILIAISGIAMLYEGDNGITLDPIGILFVMISSLSYAIYIVAVNQTRLKDMATVKVTFYVLIFGLSVFIAMILAGSELIVPSKWFLWGNIVALALFPTAISFVSTTKAIQYIGSTPTAILGALEPVTAVIFGVTIFGESFTPKLAAGIVMIIFSVTMIIAKGNITTQMLRFRKLFPKLIRRHK